MNYVRVTISLPAPIAACARATAAAHDLELGELVRDALARVPTYRQELIRHADTALRAADDRRAAAR